MENDGKYGGPELFTQLLHLRLFVRVGFKEKLIIGNPGNPALQPG